MSGGKQKGETELRNLVGWRQGVAALGRPVLVPIARGCDKCGAPGSVRYGVVGSWFCTDCWVASAGEVHRGVVA